LSAGAIGRDLRDAGEFAESIEIIQDTVEKYRRTWGPEARGTLVEQANLCISLRKAGRASEAVERLDDSYEKLREIFGKDSPDTLSARHSRTMNYLALGDERALAEMSEVYNASIRLFGAGHPQTLAFLNNLALVKRAHGDAMGALETVREAAEKLGGHLEPTHPRVLGATLNLAVCSAEAGEVQEAVRLAELAHIGMTDMLGPDHPDTLRARANLVLIRRLAGEPGLEGELSEAKDQLAARLGERHQTVQSVRRNSLLHKIIDPHPF
jgi:hypothetical protein